MKRRLLTVGLLLILAVSLTLTLQIRTLFKPMPNVSANDIVVIDQHMTAKRLIHYLYEKKYIHTPRLMLLLMKLKGVTTSLKAGIYEIFPTDSAMQFVYRVIDGKVLKKSFTIIEGTTQATIAQNLKQAPFLKMTGNDWGFDVNSLDPADKPRGVEVVARTLAAGIGNSAEGLVLADTYQYDAGSTSTQLLQRANKALNQTLNDIWLKRDAGLPYHSSYELLTAASIIEKEAKSMDEKKLVSSVLVNRLKIRMPLQMDPTIIYALKNNYKGRLTKADLKIESPYNTYLHYGLPPTPIAMVGVDALTAAAHPTPSNYLYYVAKGDGTHMFSVNYRQQVNAVHQYQQKGTR